MKVWMKKTKCTVVGVQEQTWGSTLSVKDGTCVEKKREILLSRAELFLSAAMHYLCRCSAASIGCSFLQTSFPLGVRTHTPSYRCQTSQDETFAPPLVPIRYRHASRAPPSAHSPTFPNSSSNPVLPLAPTTHHLLHQNSQLPWQQ